MAAISSQQAPAAPQAAPQEGGWLRDVLRNASASQQAGTQRPLNLSSLTEEIARAMDTDALSTAWTRYQDGESGAFNRRLYTITGQATSAVPSCAASTREYPISMCRWMFSTITIALSTSIPSDRIRLNRTIMLSV